MHQEWMDYSIIISQKEIWIIESKYKINVEDILTISKRIDSLKDIAIKKADSMRYVKGSNERWEFINESYGADIEKYINFIDEINVYRVIL